MALINHYLILMHPVVHRISMAVEIIIRIFQETFSNLVVQVVIIFQSKSLHKNHFESLVEFPETQLMVPLNLRC